MKKPKNLYMNEDLEAEKAPRLSKFTSERVKPISLEDNLSRSSQVHSVKNTTGTTRAPKVFINPHHRGVLRPQGSTPHSLPLPWEAAVRVPSVPGLRHPVALPLPNSVTMLPQVSHSVPFPIVPSSSTDFSRPPPQIMPLPNYSTPPPSVYSYSTVSSRSSSRSPYRRVHSRSRRSSSRRPFNHRSRNEVIRRRSRDRLKKSGDGHRESVYHYDRTRNRANDVAKQEKTMECAKAIGLDSEYLTKLEEQKKMREVIYEKRRAAYSNCSTSWRTNFCIRPEVYAAVEPYHGIRNGRKEPVSGTSSDVSREAVNVNRLEASVCAEKGVATNSSVIQKMEPAVVGNDPNMEQTAARVTAVTSVRRAKRENEQNPERTRKKKAYLAVVISSLNQAPINVDRIRIIAETIGPTKKVWRSSENTVSLIFEEHESAKKFMFHYHNRVIHGVQLAVTLQKLFANLTELP
ncbi:Uncharacterized protein BM_BM12663 [Brugia malayi]|uniref:Uncharacterized protein n=1 Tax=Brugia malayi TaxID=6279 RepID=A0A4E9FSZ3_BRUMA|nr:Uncharacterized protein BM_BM12663 [Brugia malayi]VIP00435.1 Uncharacterized protein BM_BM12663 [Brugia malayi]